MNVANKQRIKARIQNGDTLLGYIDWVIGKLESLGA